MNKGRLAGAFVSGALAPVGIGAVSKIAGNVGIPVLSKIIQIVGNSTVSAAASVPGTLAENAHKTTRDEIKLYKEQYQSGK